MKKELKKLFACITVCALAVSSSLAVSATAISPTTYTDDFTGYTDEALAEVTNGTDAYKPVLVNSDKKGWSSWNNSFKTSNDGNCYVIVDARNATNAKGNTISGFESDGAKSLFIRSTSQAAVGVRPADFSGTSPKLGVPNYGDSITGYNYTGFKFRMTHTNSPDSYTGLRILSSSTGYYAGQGNGFLFGLLGSNGTLKVRGNIFDGENTVVTNNDNLKKSDYAGCPIFAVFDNNMWYVYSLASNIKVLADGGNTNAQYIDWDIEINGKKISWTATATYLDGSTKSWVSSYTNNLVQTFQIKQNYIPFLFNRISYDSTTSTQGMYVTNFSATYTKWNDISAKNSADSVSLYVKPAQLTGATANKISYIYAAYDASGALLGAQIAESDDVETATVEKKVFSKPTDGTIATQKIYVWDGEVNACKPLLSDPVAVK